MSVSSDTKQFVEEKPFLSEMIRQGIINYSAVAREIIRERKLDPKTFDAIVVSLRRLSEQLRKDDKSSRIRKLLRESSFEVKSRICVFVLSDKAPFSTVSSLVADISSENEQFHLIRGSKSITIITHEKFSKTIKKKFKQFIVSEKEGLVEILIRSSPEIEKLPGVVAFFYSRLGNKGINIIETASSWTDTLFVVKEKDLEHALKAIKA